MNALISCSNQKRMSFLVFIGIRDFHSADFCVMRYHCFLSLQFYPDDVIIVFVRLMHSNWTIKYGLSECIACLISYSHDFRCHCFVKTKTKTKTILRKTWHLYTYDRATVNPTRSLYFYFKLMKFQLGYTFRYMFKGIYSLWILFRN